MRQHDTLSLAVGRSSHEACYDHPFQSGNEVGAQIENEERRQAFFLGQSIAVQVSYERTGRLA